MINFKKPASVLIIVLSLLLLVLGGAIAVSAIISHNNKVLSQKRLEQSEKEAEKRHIEQAIERSRALSGNQTSAVEQRAKAYLQPLLHSGESTTNIIARFGTPFGQAKTSVPGLTTWSFQLPDKDRAALPAEVFGFTALVTNSQLVGWEPIYQK